MRVTAVKKARAPVVPSTSSLKRHTSCEPTSSVHHSSTSRSDLAPPLISGSHCFGYRIDRQASSPRKLPAPARASLCTLGVVDAASHQYLVSEPRCIHSDCPNRNPLSSVSFPSADSSYGSSSSHS